jgi:anti-sigma factor RsiW
MNCASIDLKEYLLGESGASERRAVEEHLNSCQACTEEHERLRLTQAALLTVREEEMPRRIAFVSDKVFEPRWYQRLWQSGPRLAFASAAMLSGAILVHAFYQPVPVAAPAVPAVAVDVDRRVSEEVSRRMNEAVAKAVAEVEARQQKRTAELVAAAEKRMNAEQQETLAAAAISYEQLYKRVMYLEKQQNQMASVEFGGAR